MKRLKVREWDLGKQGEQLIINRILQPIQPADLTVVSKYFPPKASCKMLPKWLAIPNNGLGDVDDNQTVFKSTVLP